MDDREAVQAGHLYKLKKLEKCADLNGELVEVHKSLPSQRFKCKIIKTNDFVSVHRRNLGEYKQMEKDSRGKFKTSIKRAVKSAAKLGDASFKSETAANMLNLARISKQDALKGQEVGYEFYQSIEESQDSLTGKLYYEAASLILQGITNIMQTQVIDRETLSGFATALRLDTIVWKVPPFIEDLILEFIESSCDYTDPDILVLLWQLKALPLSKFGRLQLVNSLMEIAPEESHFYYVRGAVLVMLDRSPEAFEDFQKVFQMTKKNTLLYEIAETYSRMGKNAEAIKYWSQYIEKHTPCARKYAEAHVGIAMVHLTLGDLEKAKEYYELALKYEDQKLDFFPKLSHSVGHKISLLKMGFMMQDDDLRQCGFCKRKRMHMQRCSCGKVYYCNKRCQKRHFKKHKKNCTEYLKQKESAV